MAGFRGHQPSGVIPATLLAFHEDLSIDEGETRRHLRSVAGTRGVSAITVNAHASEVHACSFEELRSSSGLCRTAAGGRTYHQRDRRRNRS